MAEFKKGDRVKIVPSENWLQPRRGWAERGRQGTVTNVIKRHLGSIEIAVFFDRTRNPHQLEYFKPKDLVLVEGKGGKDNG